jgi:hypothetical protein
MQATSMNRAVINPYHDSCKCSPSGVEILLSMELVGQVQCPHERVAGPYPEADASNKILMSYFYKININIIHASVRIAHKGFRLSDKNLVHNYRPSPALCVQLYLP